MQKLLSSTPASMPIAIRYPIFNYEFAHGTTMTTQDLDRLGFHDDCFLADAADMGTYDQNSWLGWFDVAAKKQWVYDMATSTGGRRRLSACSPRCWRPRRSRSGGGGHGAAVTRGRHG